MSVAEKRLQRIQEFLNEHGTDLEQALRKNVSPYSLARKWSVSDRLLYDAAHYIGWFNDNEQLARGVSNWKYTKKQDQRIHEVARTYAVTEETPMSDEGILDLDLQVPALPDSYIRLREQLAHQGRTETAKHINDLTLEVERSTRRLEKAVAVMQQQREEIERLRGESIKKDRAYDTLLGNYHKLEELIDQNWADFEAYLKDTELRKIRASEEFSRQEAAKHRQALLAAEAELEASAAQLSYR